MTKCRTECTHTFDVNFKRMCKSYNCLPCATGFQEATGSTVVTQCGRQVKPFFNKLANIDNRQVGNRDCTRVSNSLPQSTRAGATAKPSYILRRAKLLNTEGGMHPFGEGGCNQGTRSSTSGEFLFNPIPCSQERGPDETSYQPQEVERMGGTPALQNGGFGDTQGATEVERLDGEGGPKGCLLHSSNSCDSPTHATLSGGAGTLSVHMPAFRPVMCTLGVHQGHETSIHLPSEHGSPNDRLHRRHTSDGRVCSTGETSPGSPTVPVDRLGIHNQCSQVSDIPYSANRVPGSPGTLFNTTPESSRGKAPPYKVGGESNSAEASGDGTSTCSSYREAARSIPSSPSGSLILSVPARGSAESPDEQQPRLHCIPHPIPSSQGGAAMVAGETLPMEWQGLSSPEGNSGDKVRCISAGMGGSLQWHQDRGALEPGGAGAAHKLPGVVCSNLSSAIISEGSGGSFGTVTARQSDSCSICQQPRGNSFPTVDKTGKGAMDVGPGQGHYPCRGTHTGDYQLCGRCRVQNSGRQNRLESPSRDIQEDQSAVGSTRGGLICVSSVESAPTLLQLEAGPISRSNRCLQPALGSSEGICKSPVVLSRQSSLPGEEPASSNNSCGSGVEGTAMVSSSVANAIRLPEAASTQPRGVSRVTSQGSDGVPASTGRVAYLRQRFGSANLSEKAKELLLASWRSKTSRSYDSHFKKWLGWCTERDCDPISGPASDVANFLAELHSQGYQTNSLNAYRSAISSVHDKVDDVEVGKHPLVARLLKGAFHARPPLPRYSGTWNVQVVLDCMLQWGDTSTLSLKLLTFKLVMLMSLARPSRSADLVSLHLDNCQFKPEGVVFLPSSLAKQSRQGKPLTDYFFASFPDNKQLCPVETLHHYRHVTAPLRKRNNQLFIGIVKPHNPVTSSTIARWLKEVLKMSGIDVTKFTAHSTRGASSSAAADSGITTGDILKTADWSTESVFRKFYYRSSRDPSYGRAVLSRRISET